MTKTATIAFRVGLNHFQAGEAEAQKRGCRSPHELARLFYLAQLDTQRGCPLTQLVRQQHLGMTEQLDLLTQAMSEMLIRLDKAE